MALDGNTKLQFIERRKYERIPVEIGADAIMSNSESTFACTILDISEGGAKVEVPEIDIIPVHFKLYVPDSDQIFSCRVVWRDENHLGLQFTDDAVV